MATRKSLTGRVTKRIDVTKDLMKLWIEPPSQFEGFKAGQYCTVGLNGIYRPFSIASAPGDPLIELFIELIPESVRTPKSLTPMLWEVWPGDTIDILPRAKGTFLFDANYRVHIMIATVTGVTPYISMLRMLKTRSKPDLKTNTRIYVFHGASYYDEFGYFDELQLRHIGAEIIYVPTVSRPTEQRNAKWHGTTGRVNLIVEDYLDRYRITPEDALVYLCGNEDMIDDLGNEKPTEGNPLGRLVSRGYTIRKEIFF